MSCGQAAFETKPEARRAKRSLARRRQLHTYGYLCEDCDKYHLGISGKLFSEQEIELVTLIAQGLTVYEIARMKKGQDRAHGLEDKIKKMKSRLYATSATNLVAILIALGAIDTRPLIAPLGEHNV